jgi:hypothetical protein
MTTPTGPVAKSRARWLMPTSGTPMPNGTWLTVGKDTGAYMNWGGNVGSDITLDPNGYTLHVVPGTYLVRAAYQFTSYHGTINVRIAPGTGIEPVQDPAGYAWGDCDPLTIATTPNENGDYIGEWTLGFSAPGSFPMQLMALGDSKAPYDTLDGFDITITQLHKLVGGVLY